MSDPIQAPNLANWNKPLSFVIPVEVTVMVDDPTNPSYKGLAEEKIVKPAMNELRSVLQNLDKSGKFLFVRFRPTMSLPDFESLLTGKPAPPPPAPPEEQGKLDAIIAALKSKGIM